MKYRISIVLVIFIYSASAFAIDPSKLKIRILSASWCHACHTLLKNLRKAGVVNEVPLTYKGKKILLPLSVADVSNYDDEAPKFDARTTGLPEIQVLENDRVIYGSNLRYKSSGIKDIDDKEAIEKFLDKASVEEFENLILSVIEREERLQSLFEKVVPILQITQKKFQPLGVVLIGTGGGPWEKPLFTGFTLLKAKTFFGDRDIGSNSIVTLYGSGGENEATAVKSISMEFSGVDAKGQGYTNSESKRFLTKVPNMTSDSPFSRGGLQNTFLTLEKQAPQRTVVVISGHGAKDGISLWDDTSALVPDEMTAYISRSQVPTIIVSGICYGGQFAKAAACGFFGARPDTLASGCWEYEDADVKDYVDYFFRAFQKENLEAADFDKSGDVTLEEAHWYTVINGAITDVPYTTVDALAEEYFLEQKGLLPEDITVGALRDIVAVLGTPGEKAAFEKLSDKLKDGLLIYVQPKEIPVSNLPLFGKIKIEPFGGDRRYPETFDLDSASQQWVESQFRQMPGSESLGLKFSKVGGYTFQEASIDNDLIPKYADSLQKNAHGKLTPPYTIKFAIGTTMPPRLPEETYREQLDIDAPVSIEVSPDVYDVSRLYQKIYRPALAQLAKRMIYKKQSGGVEREKRMLEKIVSCESGTLP